MEGHSDHVQHTAVHSTTFVTCSRDHSLRIWDLRSATCRSVLRGHEGVVVTFQSDAAKIVSGSWDGTVRVWRHSTGELLDTMNMHGGQVRALAYDDIGLLMTGDSDGELYCHNYGLL